MLGWVRWEYIYYLKVCRAINPYISVHLRKGPVCPYSTNFIILTVVVQKFHFHLQSKLLKHSTIYVYKCDSHTCAWMLFLTRYSFSFLFPIVFETLIASYFKGLIYLEVSFLDAAVVGTLFMRKFSSSVYLLYPSCWLFTPSASKCTMTNSTLCFFLSVTFRQMFHSAFSWRHTMVRWVLRFYGLVLSRLRFRHFICLGKIHRLSTISNISRCIHIIGKVAWYCGFRCAFRPIIDVFSTFQCESWFTPVSNGWKILFRLNSAALQS